MEPPPPSYDYAISGELLPYPTTDDKKAFDAGGVSQRGHKKPSAPPPEATGQGTSNGASSSSGDPEETKSREDKPKVAPPESNSFNVVTRNEGTANPSVDNNDNGTSPARGTGTSNISPVDNNHNFGIRNESRRISEPECLTSLPPDDRERANFQNEVSTLLKAKRNRPVDDSSRPSIFARLDRSSKIALSCCLCFSVIMIATAIGATVYFAVTNTEYPKISPRSNLANQWNPNNCRDDPPILARGTYQSVEYSASCHSYVFQGQYPEGTKCNFLCDFRDQYNLPRQNIEFTCIEGSWVSTFGELECVDFDEEVEDLRSGGEGPY